MKNIHTVTTTLEGKVWTDILDSIFKKQNAKVTIAGFRKGKAPKNIFLKKFGVESLYEDAINKALPIAFDKAEKENNILSVCPPKADIKNIDDKHVEFEFTIITKPEVKVSSYKNLGVKKQAARVTKEEIETELNNMRSRFAEIVVKDTGSVVKGDVCVIDFEGFVDGVAFDGGKGNDYPLEIGSNTFIPGFEDQLIGAKLGDKIDVKVKFPENYVDNLKGKEAIFKVTINEIKERILPEINEDFFKDLGYDDVKTEDDLKAKIKEHILSHKKEEVENKYIDDLIAAGIKNMTVEINDEIIEEELDRIIKDLSQKLSMQGITLEQYLTFTKTTIEKFRENAREGAITRIKSRYLIDEVIEKEKLDVSQEEVKKHAEEQAKTYQMKPEELIEMYGGIDVVKYDLLVHKAFDVLQNN